MVEITEVERGKPDLCREPLRHRPVGADPLPLEIDAERAGRAVGIELAGQGQPALKPRAERRSQIGQPRQLDLERARRLGERGIGRGIARQYDPASGDVDIGGRQRAVGAAIELAGDRHPRAEERVGQGHAELEVFRAARAAPRVAAPAGVALISASR